MDLLPDEEQQAIIDQTASFLESELPLARFHELGGQPEAQRSTVQHSTPQHSAAQRSTTQHSAAQRSTAQRSCV